MNASNHTVDLTSVWPAEEVLRFIRRWSIPAQYLSLDVRVCGVVAVGMTMLFYFIVNAWFAYSVNQQFVSLVVPELAGCPNGQEAAKRLIHAGLADAKLKPFLETAFTKSPGTRPAHLQVVDVLDKISVSDDRMRGQRAEALYRGTTGNRSSFWAWCFWVDAASTSEDRLFEELDQASAGELSRQLDEASNVAGEADGAMKKRFVKRFAGKLATQLLPTLRWVRRLNGWVQWVTVWLGWLILVIVGRRALMSQRLSRVINAEGFEMVWGDATEADKLLRGCLQELRDIRESIDGNGGSHADKLSLLHAKIDRLRDQLDSDVFTQLGYLLSLLPSLGFIGTVIGMGEALLKADGLFSQSDRQQTISLITKELGFAFDTTLVALVAGIVTGAVITWQRQREHDWLKKIPSYWVSSHSIRAAQTSSGVKAEERTDLSVGNPK